jgi:site-specific DNA recombinase
MTSALIYARVSDDPTGKGRSVDSQIDECRRWADREGWEVTAEVKDIDRSASRHAKREREGWGDVVTAVEGGDIDVVVTWEASRAQRDLTQYTKLRKLCERTQTRWAYSGNVYDMTDSTDRFRTSIDAVMAENESDKISDRVLRGVRSAAMDGRPSGRRLFGYRHIYDPNDGHLVGQEPDGVQSVIVAEVADRFLAGESLQAIASDLTDRGVTTSRGSEWRGTSLHRMLTNPAYNAQRVHRGEVVARGTWEPILNDDVWAKVTAKLSDPTRSSNRARSGANLLTSTARCGKCGGPLRVRGVTGEPKAYVCYDCHGVSRNLETLDAYITAIVLERLNRDDVDLTDDPPVEAVEARSEVDELRERLEDAATSFVAGELSATMLARVEGELKGKIADAEKRSRYAGLPSTVPDLAEGDSAVIWGRLSGEQRREVVRSLMSIRVDPVSHIGSNQFDPDAIVIDWKR